MEKLIFTILAPFSHSSSRNFAASISDTVHAYVHVRQPSYDKWTQVAISLITLNTDDM